jgi:hypothetical protein
MKQIKPFKERTNRIKLGLMITIIRLYKGTVLDQYTEIALKFHKEYVNEAETRFRELWKERKKNAWNS